MAIVKFNSVEEFSDELRKEKGNIERRIVRLTDLFTPSKLSPNIRLVQVIATFIVCAFPAALPAAGPHIVRLERYCGDIWPLSGTAPPSEADLKTMERAKEVSEQIEAVCRELSLEVRAGVIEEGEGRGDGKG